VPWVINSCRANPVVHTIIARMLGAGSDQERLRIRGALGGNSQ
jgi:hypothetical protein